MFINDLTFVVFTFNEESRIERVIQNFKPFGKVLVVDNFSIDKTVEIAKNYECDVLMHKNKGWVEEENTVRAVKDVVLTNWIYWAFADEMIGHKELKAISDAIYSGQYDVINICRKNYYYGVFCQDMFIARMNRVFKKEAIDFGGNQIHGFGKVVIEKTRVKYLSKDLYVHHFISNDVKSYVNTLIRYSDIEQRKAYRNRLEIIIYCSKLFIKEFFVQGGYKAGLPGLYLIFIMIAYVFINEVRNFEAKNKLNVTHIEKLNNRFRDNILTNIKKQ